MKVMEAPKKIYLYPSDRAGEEYDDEWGDKPWGEGCVEYIRSDAFIEKATDYLFNNMRCDGYTLQTKLKFIKEFKNYLEGG